MDQIAFIIPCYNEQESIGLVINDIQGFFPSACIYVCDNNSSDRTADVARVAGATVFFERKKGKGNAVRRLLRDVDADIFIMVDGDNTYDLSKLCEAIHEFQENRFDLMTGDRFAYESRSSFRKGHGTGNLLFTSFFRLVFGIQTSDVFSGLRIFSRRLVKTFPLVSAEFEIETELTIYAARMRMPSSDFPTSVRERVNSESKLSTLRDGLKILLFSLRLLHREFPMKLYLPLSFLAIVISLILFSAPYSEYVFNGTVTKVPTLIVSTLFASIGLLSFFVGLILKEISNLKYDQRYLSYLDYR